MECEARARQKFNALKYYEKDKFSAKIRRASQFGAPPFKVSTVRYNPAAEGAVTGDATYASFMSSMLEAGGKGPGVHFC